MFRSVGSRNHWNRKWNPSPVSGNAFFPMLSVEVSSIHWWKGCTVFCQWELGIKSIIFYVKTILCCLIQWFRTSPSNWKKREHTKCPLKKMGNHKELVQFVCQAIQQGSTGYSPHSGIDIQICHHGSRIFSIRNIIDGDSSEILQIFVKRLEAIAVAVDLPALATLMGKKTLQ